MRQYPDYDWLTKSGLQFWTVSEVAKNLNIGPAAVRARCESGAFDGALFYGVQIGWRIPRSGLIVYLATLARDGRQFDAS